MYRLYFFTSFRLVTYPKTERETGRAAFKLCGLKTNPKKWIETLRLSCHENYTKS